MEATGIEVGSKIKAFRDYRPVRVMTGVEIQSIFRGSRLISIYGLHMLTF